jgi:hypothetical protein
MEQSPSWEANRSSASQKISRILLNPKVHHRIHKKPLFNTYYNNNNNNIIIIIIIIIILLALQYSVGFSLAAFCGFSVSHTMTQHSR